MIIQFINEYINKLIEIDFNIVAKDDLFYTNRLDESTKFVSLIKHYGTNLYRIIICNTKNIDLNNYYNLMQTHTNQILSDDNMDFKNIYNIHIFISTEDSLEVNRILTKGKPFENDLIYNIFWSVILNNTQFKFNYNKSQPSEIIGINKILLTAAEKIQTLNYNNEDYSYDIDSLRKKKDIKVSSKTPYCCILIFSVNILALVVLELTGGSSNVVNLLRFGALHPNIILSNGEYYRIITSFFLHSGVLHFLSNTLGLYIFGTRVEKYFGSFNFLFIYMLSGICSSIFSILFTQSVSVGSSGAVYGLIGAVCAKTYLLNKNMDGLSAYTIIIIIIAGLGSGFVIPYIDNYGHIGGLLMGIAIGWVITKLERNPNK